MEFQDNKMNLDPQDFPDDFNDEGNVTMSVPNINTGGSVRRKNAHTSRKESIIHKYPIYAKAAAKGESSPMSNSAEQSLWNRRINNEFKDPDTDGNNTPTPMAKKSVPESLQPYLNVLSQNPAMRNQLRDFPATPRTVRRVSVSKRHGEMELTFDMPKDGDAISMVSNIDGVDGSNDGTLDEIDMDNAEFHNVHTVPRSSRRDAWWEHFSTVSSIIYAVGLFVIGFVFYVGEIFVDSTQRQYWTEYFNIYLSTLGIVWLVWLMVDVNLYLRVLDEKLENEQPDSNIKIKHWHINEQDGTMSIVTKSIKLQLCYAFTTGRHTGSIFLKIGAALFCLGHLVFIGLKFGRQIVFFVDDSGIGHCQNIQDLVYCFLNGVYSFLLLYILFKYSNVIVNKSRVLARFAFMHCIAASLCFWIFTIVQETMDTIVSKEYFPSKNKCKYPDDDDDYALDFSSLFRNWANNRDVDDGVAVLCYAVNNTCGEAGAEGMSFNVDCKLSEMCECADNNDIAKYIFQLGPFLYPFSIEFNILIVGVLYVMWSNVGKVASKKSTDFSMTPRNSMFQGQITDLNDSRFVVADCHSTVTGIFVGLFYFILTLIALILFFIMIASSDCNIVNIGIDINDIFECFLLASLVVATVWVYWKLAKLDVNPHAISFLDDLLLIVCIPSFFLYFMVSLLPIFEGSSTSYGALFSNLLMILQICIQTPMIVDGLRRSCHKEADQRQKPGRNILAFLIIGNIAVYLWETMEVKGTAYQKSRKDFYGNTVWTLLSHLTLPLCIFYRFHASVALVDIWNGAYEPPHQEDEE